MNKMRTSGRFMFVVLLFAGIAFGDETSDVRIKSVIVRSTLYVDDPDLAIEDFRYAKGLCAGDTNRFARLLCEAANTNNAWISGCLTRKLGYHGTSAQLPFLYSMATNVQHGASAVESILRLEGVTRNSVEAVGAYLSMTNVDFEYRAAACETLLRTAARSQVSPPMRQRARDCALQYARTANRYVSGVDAAFVETDPSYRFSKRRLSVLRSAYALGVSQYQVAYVTNAINELVAYPEADLPE